MSRLSGKVALVTGGARGMGEAHARRFIAEGAKVILTDILDAEGQALARDLGEHALFLHHDVTRESQWLEVVEAAEAAFGPISVLVNNAGIVLRGALETFGEEDYRKVIDINQVSVFLGMKAVAASMTRAGGGSIINVSSVAGLVGRPHTIAYTASKFAVRGMTKVAAAELGAFGIRVNSIHPGAVMTPMLGQVGQDVRDSLTSQLAIKRIAEPEEVTNLVLFLASDESRYCTAAEFVIDGGMTGQ